MNFMAIIDGLGRLKEAIQSGKEVADPALWKNRALTTNKIAIVFSFVIVALKICGVEIPVDDDTLNVGAAGLAGLLFLANNIITLVTSKKVGV